MDFYMGKGQYMDGADTDMLCELACQYHELELPDTGAVSQGTFLDTCRIRRTLSWTGLPWSRGTGLMSA